MQDQAFAAIQNVLRIITEEMQKVIIGKKDVVRKILMSVLADGHILLDDVPGVGKTTMAVALMNAGLIPRRYKRELVEG